MSGIRVACQTYTWEMLGAEWRGRVTDLLDWISGAGYEGLEITNTMIGEFADRPQDFAAELQTRNLQLACFAYASTSGFTEPERRADDLAGGRRAVAFLEHFPGAKLGLGGAASAEHTTARLDHAIGLYNELGELASRAGISANVHPHSHYGSLLETAEEYEYLLQRLDPRYLSFGPDTGHIVRGGQDLLTCLRTHRARITHLHLKDADEAGHWQPLGQGAVDFPAALALLKETGYEGWVVGEEESAAARRDGVGAVRHNREYLRGLGV